MKLQKLAFYAKVWTLVANQPFIDAEFERWPYGPVNTSIYETYQEYGKAIIAEPKNVAKVANSHTNLLKFILDEYIDYSAFSLSAMTHNELPWQETPHKAIISDESLLKYYSTQSFSKNFLGNSDKFYLLQSANWQSFTLDMTPDDAESFLSVTSHSKYIEQRDQAKSEWEDFLAYITEESA